MRSDNNSSYGLPIISIYILGHILGDLKEPVIYVRRRYLDYDDQVIEQKDQEIEEKEQLLVQQTKIVQEMVSMLTQAGISVNDIAEKLSLSPEEVRHLL